MKRQLELYMAEGAQRRQHIVYYIQEKGLRLISKLLHPTILNSSLRFSPTSNILSPHFVPRLLAVTPAHRRLSPSYIFLGNVWLLSDTVLAGRCLRAGTTCSFLGLHQNCAKEACHLLGRLGMQSGCGPVPNVLFRRSVGDGG